MNNGYCQGEKELRRINICLTLGGLATFAVIYATQPLLPTLTNTFNIPPASAALSVSNTCLALGIALLFIGPISDRFGRVPVMLVSVFISSMLCIASGFVSDWNHFLAIRMLIGVAVSGLPAVATSYIREEVNESWAVITTGLYIGGTAIGGMLGRFVASGLADLYNWQAAMIGIGTMSLICSVFIFLFLPRSQNFTPVTIHPKHLMRRYLSMFTDPILVLLYLAGFMAMGMFVSIFNVIGFRLESNPYNLSVAIAGLIYITYIFGSIASYLSGRAITKIGARAVLAAGSVISLVGLLITLSQPLWILLLGIVFIVIGFFVVHATASSWISIHAQKRGTGIAQASSLYLFFYYFGSSTCGTLTPAVWSTNGWLGVVIITGILVLIGITISLFLYQLKSKAT